MKKHKSPILSLATVLFLMIAAAFYFFFQPGESVPSGVSPVAPSAGSPVLSELPAGEDTLRIVYIDVGQGDSALILTPDGKAMLIDAGEATAKNRVADVLKEYGVTTLNMLVATHPHSDHIGGMQYIVENFQIEQVCLPNVSHTSQGYENLLLAIQEKGIPALEAKAGKSFELGSEVHCEILAPVQEEYENLNNYSAVIRVCFGETSFLFTGDAEALSEAEILENTPDSLRSTVLKVGHHGSKTSSSDAFIKAVFPEAAVISCASENSYGHPHTETLETLARYRATIYRTDELGDILAYSDGKKVLFAKPGTAPTPASEKIDTVYITSSGKSYHRKGCQYYNDQSIALTVEEAKNLGYQACTKCMQN